MDDIIVNLKKRIIVIITGNEDKWTSSIKILYELCKNIKGD